MRTLDLILQMNFSIRLLVYTVEINPIFFIYYYKTRKVSFKLMLSKIKTPDCNSNVNCRVKFCAFPQND
jgi:hypothetical protein